MSSYILPQYMLFGMLAHVAGAPLGPGAASVSFGQAGFFALGAYAMGLVMQQTVLPVNRAYLGHPRAAAARRRRWPPLIGYFLFSAGVRASYFVMVTLALSIIVEQTAISQSPISPAAGTACSSTA